MYLCRGKPEKTNWVMHQYHSGTEEDEKQGEYVVSKIFYQQQQQQFLKQSDKAEQEAYEAIFTMTPKPDPVTPRLVTPLSCVERCSGFDLLQESVNSHAVPVVQISEAGYEEDRDEHNREKLGSEDEPVPEKNHSGGMMDDNENEENKKEDENHAEEDPKWWDSGSQCILDSQQLVEALSLCDDLLQSQSLNREENTNNGASKTNPRLSNYARLGTENFKRDLEECQNVVLHPSSIKLDTPPEFRLSQLEFGSQESFLDWGGGKTTG